MTLREVVEALRGTSNKERREGIRAAEQSIRDEPDADSLREREELKEKLRRATEIMRPYYEAGGELTAFTALDGEAFHDYDEEEL